MTATTRTRTGTGSDDAPSRPPIAVVGVSALFPGSIDSTGYWNDILSGADRMVDIPETHWLISDHYDADPNAPDKTYGKRGGFLAPVDFDAMGFGVPPNLVPSTDTAQLLALIVAQRVLDDAMNGQFDELDRNRASVILGVTSGQELFGAMVSRMNRPMWLQGMRRAGIPEAEAQEACERIASLHPEWTEATFPGLLGNVVAGRIANRLDLGGTNCVTDAACASSFSAISMGVNELYLGDSDLVIAGGVDTMNDIFMYMCFSKTPALSKSGDIRPFSAQADGTMLGEGLGMVALKRLEDAERDGNRIYCVLNGVGSSSDGRSKSVYAPVSAGQARALNDAYAKAGYGPDTVELVEAHGTGTVAGDAAEFGGLQLAFDESGRSDRQWCALGSVKSQIGHTKSAAGAAGLIKVVMALHHKVLPQTAKIDEPNPALDLQNSPFHLNTRTRPWVRGSDHERRGSVSSFGFGGSNFHIALSEYVGEGERASRLRTDDVELVVVTGSDGVEVRARAAELAVSIAEDRNSGVGSHAHLAHLARSSQSSYTGSEPARLAVVARDLDDLRAQLETAIDLLGESPDRPFSVPSGAHFGLGTHEGEIALLFPGQGSQYPEMGIGVATAFSESMGSWDLAADQDWGDTALHEVVFPITTFADGEHAANVERLTATRWAQPAIGAMSMSLLALLRAVGVDASHVGGHSFGEIVALHAADVLTAADAITVARRRGELMAEAARTPGSMTAVTASIDAVEVVVEQADADVVIANHNSHRQSVLSGPTEAIERIESALDDAGLRYTRLPVATAFHSSVVASASDAFHEFLHGIDIGVASIPVYANETATLYPSGAGEVRSQLARQISNPVRFVDMIESMYDNGARTFVEVGPSSVLTGLVGNILDGQDHRAVALDTRQGTGVKPLFDGLAKLVAAGVEMRLAALWTEYDGVLDPADVAPIKLAVPVDGSNESPYPPSDLGELAEAKSGRVDDRPVPAPMPSAPTIPSSSPTPEPVTPNPMTSNLVTPAPMTPAPMTHAPMTHAPMAPAPRADAPNPSPSRSTAVDPSILSAYQDAQHQTAVAHTAYLDSMAAAHQAFLTASQQGIAVLGQLASGGTIALPPAQVAAPQPQPQPQPWTESTAAPVAPPSAAEPAVVAPGGESTGWDAASSPPGRGSSTATESVSGGGVSLVSALLSVVADRTGYPSEMLSLEMGLESDLGIDSIKRVEILSAMQDEVPGLPEVDLSVMAGLATLGEIADYMTGGSDDTVDANEMVDADQPAREIDGGAGPQLERFVVRPEPMGAPGTPLPGLTDAAVSVVGGGELATALVDALTGYGIEASTADAVSDSSDTTVVYLAPLTDLASIDDAVARNREAFEAFASFGPRADAGGSFVVVIDQQTAHAGGDDVHAWASGITALARTAALEWPSASIKTIDIDRTGLTLDSVAAALAAELVTGGVSSDIGIRADGMRVALVGSAADVSPGTLPIGAEDVVVVSGGGRGVTATTTIELARTSGADFVLLGRSTLDDEPPHLRGVVGDAELKRAVLDEAAGRGETPRPSDVGDIVNRVVANREISATIAQIDAVGARARYVSVDVTDAKALDSALSAVRSDLGRITGVVHGAGVLADKLIVEKTPEQFARVFDTKVVGLRNLLAATAQDELTMLCLFSSVAARTGNVGQGDYSMANEVLNKVARQEQLRRGRSCVVKSIGWGPWEGGMVTDSLKSHFEAMGVALIDLDVGARAMIAELSDPRRDQVEVVLGGGVVAPVADRGTKAAAPAASV